MTLLSVAENYLVLFQNAVTCEMGIQLLKTLQEISFMSRMFALNCSKVTFVCSHLATIKKKNFEWTALLK